MILKGTNNNSKEYIYIFRVHGEPNCVSRYRWEGLWHRNHRSSRRIQGPVHMHGLCFIVDIHVDDGDGSSSYTVTRAALCLDLAIEIERTSCSHRAKREDIEGTGKLTSTCFTRFVLFLLEIILMKNASIRPICYTFAQTKCFKPLIDM